MDDQRDKIILVDDNPVNLRAGKNVLSGKYDVFTAPSAAKMLALLKKNRPILILLDIEMPEMDGYEAIKILKADPATRDIPVIFLTAKVDVDDEIRGLQLGAIDYITKPLVPELLLKRIEIRLAAEEQRKKLEQQREELKSVLNMDAEFNHIQDLDILLERILYEARRVVNADAGSIYVPEMGEKGGDTTEKLAIKFSQNDTQQKELPPGEKLVYSVFKIPINEKTISGYCAYTMEMVNVEDVYHLPPDTPFSYDGSYDLISGYRTKSVLAFPLVTAEKRLLGVLQMINARDPNGNIESFSRDDEILVSHFGANAVFVLQQSYILRAMILRMIKMAELRDPKETGTHVNRVAGYAVELYNGWARRQGISEEEQSKFRDSLRIGAMLHDVGKVAISDVILKKPGRFTPEEYLVMQYHTLYGAGLFRDPLSSLDTISREIALSHHENWDGTGYPGWVDPDTMEPLRTGEDGKPLGKKGEEIPLLGRMVAIADVYDALCSRRVYKEPWAEDDVLAEMQKMRGTKFDPELLDIFFEVLTNIKLVKMLYPEQEDQPE
ncbi:MAG: response regulator [Spirochaetaceae bacterium]|jgi:response regulator RpfG family c-di-GMP phosphodiesterase|nr:response regulator [Spirochaetaceae bacterium]